MPGSRTAPAQGVSLLPRLLVTRRKSRILYAVEHEGTAIDEGVGSD